MTRYSDDPYYISPEEEAVLDYDRLLEKAQRMRDAIDFMEGALNRAAPLLDWAEKWGTDRARPGVVALLQLPSEDVYGICDAFKELNAIVNDPAYQFRRPAPVDKPKAPLASDDDIVF